MEYNPSYIIEFNPIERIFSKIKKIYRDVKYGYIQEGIFRIKSLNKNNFINIHEKWLKHLFKRF